MAAERSYRRFPWWLAAVLVAVLFAVVAVYSVWSAADQRSASEAKVLGEARLLAEEMGAAWDYIDNAQDAINFNSDGRYDFKGVYCSVAGKSIARLFSQNTDCVIRYTRENPRTGPDVPDAFEQEALNQFEAGETEFYGIEAGENGQSYFRYLRAIPVKHGCLTCHGEPAGELDETGFPREGFQMGDLAGAVSLAIPMRQYEVEAAERTKANIGLFCALALVIVGCAVAVNAVLGRQSRQIEAMNERLEEANDHLADANGQLEEANEHLARANEALVRESEYKSTFLATMSHELRTPLASTIALVDVWEREAAGADESSRNAMAEIRSNSASLLATINNTLDAASLEAGRYRVDVTPVDMLDLVDAVEQTIAPLAAEKHVAFTVIIDPQFPLVCTDPSIMHKVLMNLLSNAVKFTDEGGAVALRIALNGRESTMEVVVADTGIGIPEEDLACIFERFRQADSSISRRYGGSGLGLALVREMAELLGGSAAVESEVGRGSVFSVRIPCKVVEEEL